MLVGRPLGNNFVIDTIQSNSRPRGVVRRATVNNALRAPASESRYATKTSTLSLTSAARPPALTQLWTRRRSTSRRRRTPAAAGSDWLSYVIRTPSTPDGETRRCRKSITGVVVFVDVVCSRVAVGLTDKRLRRRQHRRISLPHKYLRPESRPGRADDLGSSAKFCGFVLAVSSCLSRGRRSGIDGIATSWTTLVRWD